KGGHDDEKTPTAFVSDLLVVTLKVESTAGPEKRLSITEKKIVARDPERMASHITALLRGKDDGANAECSYKFSIDKADEDGKRRFRERDVMVEQSMPDTKDRSCIIGAVGAAIY